MKKLFLLAIINLIAFSFVFGQGTVRGKVTDEKGETLIGVSIVLKANRAIGSITDLYGNYSLRIADSAAQTLVVSYISYQTTEETVHPVKGEVIIKNFILASSSKEIAQVEITAKAVKSKEYYMEKVKMNSAATIDYISSETMKKTGDLNIGTAVTRVSGVSTNGSFFTVRGIGDRYVKTAINGSKIPTLDPFTNNIKLDLFPASLVDNIIITKTASPDLPGDWAGAFLSIETKDYPEKLSLNVETSFGYNNQTTSKEVLTSQRSSTDWLGYDNGFRDHKHQDFVAAVIDPTPYQEFVALGLGSYFSSLGITENTAWNDTYQKLALVELGLLPKAQMNDDDAFQNAKDQYKNGSYSMQAFNVINANAAKSGQSFPNNWNTSYRKAPLNFSQTFSIGNQTSLFGKPLGIIAGFRYGNTVAYDPDGSGSRISVDANGKTYISANIIEQSGKESSGWSALINASYKLNSNNSISFLFMPNLAGVNKASFSVDDGETLSLNLTKSQTYEEREQMVYQFKSVHYLPQPKLKVELNASYTDGKSNIPDFKKLQYSSSPSGDSYAIGGEKGIDRYYRYLSEDVFDSRLAAELPLSGKPGLARKLLFGGAYQYNSRDYNQFEYYLRTGPKANLILENGDIDKFFSLDKFGISSGIDQNVPYSTIDLYYLSNNNPANHTIGNSNISAGFMMVDYSIVPRLRFSGGLRIEQAQMYTDAFKYDSLGLSDDDPRRQFPGEIFTLHPGKFNETSYLPSANVVYKLKNNEQSPINLRLNYSRTVARPSLRELTDIVAYDYELKGLVYGNSELKMVQINNYDLRLESWFKSGDNISVSVFYKYFKDHIEIADAPQGYTWINVDKSWVQGIELEGKKALFKNLDLSANITFVNSNTSFIQQALLITGGVKTYTPVGKVSRTMFGQAPFAINGILTYKADSIGLGITLSYNVQGPRLVISSFNKNLNIYEMPRHLLDLKIAKTLGKHFGVSVTIRDILNSPVKRAYEYEKWSVDYDTFHYGTNYVLAISYKL